MLGRANKDFEAKPPPPQRSGLAKHLFPSSSPVAAQNANIIDSFRRPSQPQAPAAPVAPSHPTLSSFVKPQHNSQRTSAMSSLYSQSASFRDEPLNVSATAAVQSSGSVWFNEDDFSDDDTLDFQQPTALPTLAKPPPPAPPTSFGNSHNLPSSSQAQAIPWSSSPASHMAHPLSRAPTSVSRTLSNGSLKREAQNGFETPQPPAKKRSLPKGWKDDPIDVDEEDDEDVMAHTRKLSRHDSLPWNTTASAVKAQKKQLKSQGKRTEEEEDNSRAYMEEVAAHQGTAPKEKELSWEQLRVLNMVVADGKSVFFTGPAGTGKSFLMENIIAALKKKHSRSPESLAVTASTGLAACNIGGITLHSFSGIGLGKEDVPTLVKKIRRNPKAKNRWLKTKVLIIDEISMVDGDLFDKLSQIGRTIRNNGKPWGGIQLVITGDFFQLPPVPDTEKKKEATFAFDATTWPTSIEKIIGLKQVFRQKDPVFASMLNEMRVGKLSDETVAAFKAMSRPLPTNDPVGTTELFATRNEVETANNSRLRGLPGELKRFEAHDGGAVPEQQRERLLANMMAPKILDLKVGAQVMLVKNMDDTLVNGSVGKVKGFSTEEVFEIKGNMRYDDDGDPTSKNAKIKGRIHSFTMEYEQAKKGANEFPVVEFAATDGTFRTILCVPEEWKVELPTGEVQASRLQVPLILAWALSIHKAQGQTLERVKVDLGRAFEKGQAYVALSRATTQPGLQVLRFEKHRVMAHPRVVNFYDNLESIAEADTKKPVSIASYAYTKSKSRHTASKEDSSIAAYVQRHKAPLPRDSDEEEAMMHAYG